MKGDKRKAEEEEKVIQSMRTCAIAALRLEVGEGAS